MYKPFNKFILRTPMFPFNFYIENKGKQSLLFKEGVLLSSYDFYSQWNSSKVDEKILNTEYKYFVRACTRSTPFGLFASCSIGDILDSTIMNISSHEKGKRTTRLDLNYVYLLINYVILNIPKVRQNVKFYVNDTIYKVGDSYRYIEYYVKLDKRFHQLVSIPSNKYLNIIINSCGNGLTIIELERLLGILGISAENASEYVNELIYSQVLKSDLDLNVTGEFPLDRVVVFLEKHVPDNESLLLIKSIQKMLLSIDKQDKHIDLYFDFFNLIDKFNIDYNKNNLLQCDLFKPCKKIQISNLIVNDVYDALSFLNLISPRKENPLLRNLKNYFLTYYNEDELVPLQKILDPDIGFSYGIDESEAYSEIAGELFFPKSKNIDGINVSVVDSIILKKIIESIQNNSKCIELVKSDFAQFKESWDDLPPTIGVMCRLISKDEFFFDIAGGSCASNILSRFSHLDQDIYSLVKDISSKDEQILGDCIVAEIVHLPESRTGNILFRPIIHKYEIQYLGKSIVENENKIYVSDLFVTVHNNSFILYSKKHKKRVVPRLTNAHNYSYNSLPIYHFLCDLQCQDLRSSFSFRLDGIFNLFDYIPRIKYGNCILSREKWKVTCSRLRDWKKDMYNVEKLMLDIRTWRLSNSIPQFTVLLEGDNELLIDLESIQGVHVLLSFSEKASFLFLEEFLWDNNTSIVRCDDGALCNELVLFYYKEIE